MTVIEAISFVRMRGIVLEAASGRVPSLVEAMIGASIRGTWWSHPRAKEIFAITRAVRASPQILVCRFVSGKVTFVHRRLWPALVRASGHFSSAQLARLREQHSTSGRHIVNTSPFPEWVTASVSAQARQLTESDALRMIESCTMVGEGRLIPADP
jgi:hypothetical protein